MNTVHMSIVFFFSCYLKAYASFTFILFTWKGLTIDYDGVLYWLQMLLLLTVISLECTCLLLSRLGQELFSAFLILPSILGMVYFILWQPYVMHVELITNSFMISLQLLYSLSSFMK
ncbi:hypothetical protein HDE_11816 [Halotydeus destructor]|nr:hypothetical protein HDE_11816 [Halotydeus destructor]